MNEEFDGFLSGPTQIEAISSIDSNASALLSAYNNTKAEYPGEHSLIELIEQVAAARPEAPALYAEDISFTYAALNSAANRLARLLVAKGVGPETIVALYEDCSIGMVISTLAILKAGGGYLPIDLDTPDEKVLFMLRDSNASLLLTHSQHISSHLMRNTETLPSISEVLFQDLLSNSLAAYPAHDIGREIPRATPDNVAYIIYTSGSTGEPKGVVMEHRGIVNYICWAAKLYIRGEPVDFPLFTPISFDLTLTSLFAPLITGNAIILYNGKNKEMRLEQILAEDRVGAIKMTPSHLKMISNKLRKNTGLKRIITGGEELDPRVANTVLENFGGRIEIFNEYGPTETAVGCMTHTYDPAKNYGKAVTLGVPQDNVQIYLLDDNLAPVSMGQAGEIYIAGNNLAREYLKRPEVTAKSFVKNPFTLGTRMYRTGDMARFVAPNDIEFMGRRDSQVKINGYRIELGEVENVLLNFQTPKREENVAPLNADTLATRVCTRCMLTDKYPDITFDDGVCSVCRKYDGYKAHAASYFSEIPALKTLLLNAHDKSKSKYDCLLLYSGGKDSSYVLYRLVDMGFKVLAFTFDNGFISPQAIRNIKRITKKLNVDHLTAQAPKIKEIFVESLRADQDVCDGCFKAVNALGTQAAHERGINVVLSGLSRGQIFDLKLHPLYTLGTGIFTSDEIDKKLLFFRKRYHSMQHKVSRLLDVDITDAMLDGVQFVDYFRYDSISTPDLLDYLTKQDSYWSVPSDTGLCSSNCVINEAGIYVHLKETGYHNYSAQLSWDCRLGILSREEGLGQLNFEEDQEIVHSLLNEIGYYHANFIEEAVVIDRQDSSGMKYLAAYFVCGNAVSVSELREYMIKKIPQYMIPTHFIQMDSIPLTPNGKVDRKALPDPLSMRAGKDVAPMTELERKMHRIWEEALERKLDGIGVHENFFELGGNSIRMTILIARILSDLIGLEDDSLYTFDDLENMMSEPTIQGLSNYVLRNVTSLVSNRISAQDTKTSRQAASV